MTEGEKEKKGQRVLAGDGAARWCVEVTKGEERCVLNETVRALCKRGELTSTLGRREEERWRALAGRREAEVGCKKSKEDISLTA